jgi:NADH-quinone oxidoreductase subunit L
MAVALVGLAVLTVLGGLPAIGLAGREPALFELLSEGAHGHAAEAPGKLPLAVLALSLAVSGLAIAWLLHGPARWMDRLRKWPAYGPMEQVAQSGFYFDRMYSAVVVRPFRRLSSWLWRVLDERLIDGAVNLLGRAVGTVGLESRRLQTGYTRQYLISFLVGVVVIALYFYIHAR